MGCCPSSSSPNISGESNTEKQQAPVFTSMPPTVPPHIERIMSDSLGRSSVGSNRSSTTSSELNEYLSTKYKKLRRISHGNYGVVHLVIQKSTGRLFVVKECLTEAMLVNECLALERCVGCPVIVQVEEVFTQVDAQGESVSVCIVMEYVDGVPWGHSDYSKRRGPVSCTPDALLCIKGILRDLLLGLLYLHEEANLAHMDIKAENVLVFDHDGHNNWICSHRSSTTTGSKGGLDSIGSYAKLIDLGSAVDRTMTRCTAGTLYYSAPEKFLSRVSDYCPMKADVWSLGVTAAVAIFGNPNVPFPIPTSRRTFMNRISSVPPDIPRVLTPGVPTPSDLIDMLDKMLCRNPLARPTPRDLLAHRFLTG
eukprot:PhF_6_TR6084/c0_g1_i1/m.8870/K08838/STK24_25_MST4; serine/threonine-protein kinase 24/25/MST4